MQKPAIGDGGMAQVMDEQLAVHIGGHVAFRFQFGHRGERIFERPAVEDQMIIRLGEHPQRIFRALCLGHDGHHFADARFHQAHHRLKREIGGQ